MYRFLRCLLCCIVLMCQPMKAVFTYASHLTNGKKHIYFFNDIHDAYDKAADQQIQLVSFAQRLGAYLLTEEMTDMQNLRNYIHDEKLLARIQIDCLNHLQRQESDGFPLRGLSLFARSMGVDARNIDYRQWVDAFRTGRSITGKTAMHVLDQVLEEIRGYNDNPIFNDYYAKTIHMITTVFKPLWDYLRVYDEPVCELAKTDEFKRIITAIHTDPRKKEYKYSDYWIAYDADIFDCLLLHKLEHVDQAHIIVCAGAFHCNLASDLLELIGFSKQFECGQRDLGTTPLNMSAFIHRTLQDRIDPCIDQDGRKKYIDRLIAVELDKSNRLLKSEGLKVNGIFTHFLFILVFFVLSIGIPMLLMWRIYIHS